MRNWTALNMVKLAVLIDALNRESGALGADGAVARPELLIDDIRLLRGRTDLLEMPVWTERRRGDGGGRRAAADGAATDGGPAGASTPCPPPITTPAGWVRSR